MKRQIAFILALLLAISLCACSSSKESADTASSEATTQSAADAKADDEAEVTQADIEKNIIGSWIVADRKGQPALTNEKCVFTFVSPNKADVSASFKSRPGLGSHWINVLEADVDISGNKVTLTWPANEGAVMVDELSISNTTDTENQGSLIVKSVVNGEETIIEEGDIRLVKINDDYRSDIIGTWEGRCTSEGSAFDDGQDHRWEYKDDGTYVYYVKDGDKWVPSENTMNEYFVAGNLLCTRWVENDTENREWWEITIDGDTMNWTALREGEDGKTFTVTFEMNKVEN